jgi:hypothetical protein
MTRRVRAPARLADASGRGQRKGRFSARKVSEATPQSALSLGIGLTAGRPELRSRQSRFESGLPKNPN